MEIVDVVDGLRLKDDFVFDHEVQALCTKDDIGVLDCDGLLLDKAELVLFEFVPQGLGVHFLGKAWAQGFMNLNGASDDLF